MDVDLNELGVEGLVAEFMTIDIPIKLEEGAKQPDRGHDYDAGLDLYANVESEKVVSTGEVLQVHTGVSMAIPDGYFGMICERSSMGAKGLAVRGGIIDSTYRGEIRVLIHNLSQNDYLINNGDKIAQIIILPCSQTRLEVVDLLDETERGDKGFGSTNT